MLVEVKIEVENPTTLFEDIENISEIENLIKKLKTDAHLNSSYRIIIDEEEIKLKT